MLSGCEDTTPVQRVETPPSDQVNAVAGQQDNMDEREAVNNVAIVGETLDRGGIQFTFDRVERFIDDAESFIRDTPRDGYEFILLWFTVRNTTTEDYFVNMFHESSYLDGFSISTVLMFFNVSGDSLWGNVSAGRAGRGFIGYEVPIGWTEIEFRYSPLLARQASTLIFTATSDCVE